jgi:3-oxoacyl-[acyl-carrier protein] reductase
MASRSSERPVVLITGGGTGVGSACATQFALRGFNVVVNYSRSSLEAEETAQKVTDSGMQALLQKCDVSDDIEVRAMLKNIESRFGRLDVLVNNAAITHFIEHRDLDSMTEQMWDRILAVNLKGPFFVTRAASKLLAADEGGAVVNVSSVAGKNGRGSSIAYCASKAALNTMTMSLARALAPKVRVNAVCPGPIDTRWIRQGNPSLDLNKMVQGLPIPKASQPKDIADVVLFLAIEAHMVTSPIDQLRLENRPPIQLWEETMLKPTCLSISLALTLTIHLVGAQTADAQCNRGSGGTTTATTATNLAQPGHPRSPIMQSAPTYNQVAMQQAYNHQLLASRQQAWLQQSQYVQRMQRLQRNEMLARGSSGRDSNELLSPSKSRLTARQKKSNSNTEFSPTDKPTENASLKLAAN